MCRAEQVVAAFVMQLPEPGDSPRAVVRIAAELRRSEVGREWPRDRNDERRIPGQHDRGLDESPAQPSHGYETLPHPVADVEPLEARHQRRCAASHRHLVDDDEREPDREIDPDEAAKRRRNRGEQGDLEEHGGGDHPDEARVRAREVIAHEHVHEREQRHRDGEGNEQPRRRCEVGAEGEPDEVVADERVPGGEQPAERRRDDERPTENVAGALTTRVTRRRPREENREDRGGQEERHTGECRCRRVGAGVVGREARLGDHDVHVGQQADSEQADRDGPEIAEERSERDRLHTPPSSQPVTYGPERERASRERADRDRGERPVQPLARDGHRHEQCESRDHRKGRDERERTESLVALKQAKGNGADDGHRHTGQSDQDGCCRAEAQKLPQRDGEHERDSHQGNRDLQPHQQHGSRECRCRIHFPHGLEP